ncbi:hypothetical protein MNBD_GAMMA10-2923 [hydrothermal vent metagenome]|uniref:tRNA 2-thiouridine synthesizing protein E n=1 Tax=hydrothermal vent metagenome TaxID=652676 RepID=A0A3B0YNB3_9ZZZZ
MNFDSEGYLVDSGEWNEDIAKLIGENIGISLSEHQLEFLVFIREYLEEYKFLPSEKTLKKAAFGVKGGRRKNIKIFEHFTTHGMQGVYKMAGIQQDQITESKKLLSNKLPTYRK